MSDEDYLLMDDPERYDYVYLVGDPDTGGNREVARLPWNTVEAVHEAMLVRFAPAGSGGVYIRRVPPGRPAAFSAKDLYGA